MNSSMVWKSLHTNSQSHVVSSDTKGKRHIANTQNTRSAQFTSNFPHRYRCIHVIASPLHLEEHRSNNGTILVHCTPALPISTSMATILLEESIQEDLNGRPPIPEGGWSPPMCPRSHTADAYGDGCIARTRWRQTRRRGGLKFSTSPRGRTEAAWAVSCRSSGRAFPGQIVRQISHRRG